MPLNRTYDPTLPYAKVFYGRMSHESQNPKSPDQQLASCDKVRAEKGYPWRHLRSYTDKAISGKLVGRRPGLQKMLREIRNGIIHPDLIEVDTWERFGRAEELLSLRHELRTNYGVLIVTADSGFSDPTTAVGQLTSAFESVRATEDNRIKAHNVRRGKRAAALEGYWPGGRPPKGFALKTVLIESRGQREVARTQLIHAEDGGPEVIRKLLNLAVETGWGTIRLTRALNEDKLIEDHHKPFHAGTVASWLENTLYYGTLTYDERSTGIVNDTVVVEWKDPDQVLVIENFCEPIVDKAICMEVRRLHEARKKVSADLREAKEEWRQSHGGGVEEEKLYVPLTPGIVLKYPLNGLVRCGTCKGSMVSKTSGSAEEGPVYVYYYCPRFAVGRCSNRARPTEVWLREAFLIKLRSRLFPPPGRRGEVPEWYAPFIEAVHHEIEILRSEDVDQLPAMRRDLQAEEDKAQGNSLSLSDKNLGPLSRSEVQASYEKTLERIASLREALEMAEGRDGHPTASFDPKVVLGRLQNLEKVLGLDNPTLWNLELSRVVDGIDCHPDGRIVMRTTALGLFEGIEDVLAVSKGPPVAKDLDPGEAGAHRLVKPRRRGKLRVVEPPDAGSSSAKASTDVDPARFADFGPEWFWTDIIEPPGPRPSWTEEYADEVLRQYLEGDCSHRELAKSFGVAEPTILNALKVAAARAGLAYPVKLRGDAWAVANADEVWDFRQVTLMSTTDLAKHFKHNTTAIVTALKLAAARLGLEWRLRIPAVEWLAMHGDKLWAEHRKGKGIGKLARQFGRSTRVITWCLNEMKRRNQG